MPLNDVPAQAAVRAHRPFEVDRRASLQAAEGGPAQGLAHDVSGKLAAARRGHSQAYSVDGERVTPRYVTGDHRPPYAQPGRVAVGINADDLAEFFHNPGKHRVLLRSHCLLQAAAFFRPPPQGLRGMRDWRRRDIAA